MRRIVVAGALIVAIGALLFLRSPREAGSAAPDGGSRFAPGATPTNRETALASASRPASAAPALEQDFPIAAPLNAPDSTIARDIDILQALFDAWRSNFPHEGNPVGENADITAALMGDNRLGLALIPKKHRALNERGELCDRWGTPFRFHQLSGTKMEIRSAGPDRQFATADDTLSTPE